MTTKVKTGEQWLELVNSGNTALVKTFAKKFHGIMDESGNTALILAVKKEFLDMIPILAPLEARRKDVEGFTALMHATKAGNVKACEQLVSAEYMDTLEDGCNALMLSLEREMLDVTQIFLPYFDLTPDSNGLTPIDYAACNKNYEGLKLLLERYNPPPDVVQQSIKSAQEQSNQTAVDILMEHCSTYQPRPAMEDMSDSKSDASSSQRGSKKLKVKPVKAAKSVKKDKTGKGSNASSTSNSIIESVDDQASSMASPAANELVLPLENNPISTDDSLFANRIPTPVSEKFCEVDTSVSLLTNQSSVLKASSDAIADNNQLLQRIAKLESEVLQLREENNRLKNTMGSNLVSSVVETSGFQEQVSNLVLQLSQTNERLIETIAMSEVLYSTGKV